MSTITRRGITSRLCTPGCTAISTGSVIRVINFEGGSLHDGPPKGGSNHPGAFGWRFPNFAFNSYPDGLSFMRMEPVGPRQTRLVYDYWKPDSVSHEDFEATMEYGLQVSKEDQWITPIIQENLEAGRVRSGAAQPASRERRALLSRDGAGGRGLRGVRRQSRSIRVTWSDGARRDLSSPLAAGQLRLRPRCRHPDTLERIFDPLSVPSDLDAASVSITDGGGSPGRMAARRPRERVRVRTGSEGHRDGVLRTLRGETRSPVTWGAELSEAMPGADHDTVTGRQRRSASLAPPPARHRRGGPARHAA